MQRRRRHEPLLWGGALAMLLTATAGALHHPASATTLLVRRGSADTFRPETPRPGMVSGGTAIQAAIHFAFGQSASQAPPGVRTRAYFGLYSDTLFSNRPVWIVRFWGPGLMLHGSGGPPPLPGTPYCAPRAAHEELVVIDGQRGKYLEATVGIIPTGLPTVVVTPEAVPTPCPTRPPHAMTPGTKMRLGARWSRRMPAGQAITGGGTNGRVFDDWCGCANVMGCRVRMFHPCSVAGPDSPYTSCQPTF